MSDPITSAAAPVLIVALQAIQAFNANIGTDPQQWPLKLPGAFQVLLGTIDMQLPALAVAEVATLQSSLNARIQARIDALKAGN